jgi:hypothetical protein
MGIHYPHTAALFISHAAALASLKATVGSTQGRLGKSRAMQSLGTLRSPHPCVLPHAHSLPLPARPLCPGRLAYRQKRCDAVRLFEPFPPLSKSVFAVLHAVHVRGAEAFLCLVAIRDIMPGCNAFSQSLLDLQLIKHLFLRMEHVVKPAPAYC